MPTIAISYMAHPQKVLQSAKSYVTNKIMAVFVIRTCFLCTVVWQILLHIYNIILAKITSLTTVITSSIAVISYNAYSYIPYNANGSHQKTYAVFAD